MPRKKTSKEQESPFDVMKPIKLKSGVKEYQEGVLVSLHSSESTLSALIDCLKRGDAKMFKEILRGHLEYADKNSLAEKSGISRRTLYRMLSETGNPTLDNIAKMINAISA